MDIFDARLMFDISEIDDRRDDPEIPNLLDNVPVGDFNVLSFVLSKLFGDVYPFVMLTPLSFSSFRVFDRDSRFLNVPKIVVFFRSRPRSETSPEIGSDENSLLFACCCC